MLEFKYVVFYISFQDSYIVMHTCRSWLSSVLSDLGSQTFTNVELVLRLVYMLGEVLTNKVKKVGIPMNVLYMICDCHLCKNRYVVLKLVLCFNTGIWCR